MSRPLQPLAVGEGLCALLALESGVAAAGEAHAHVGRCAPLLHERALHAVPHTVLIQVALLCSTLIENYESVESDQNSPVYKAFIITLLSTNKPVRDVAVKQVKTLLAKESRGQTARYLVLKLNEVLEEGKIFTTKEKTPPEEKVSDVTGRMILECIYALCSYNGYPKAELEALALAALECCHAPAVVATQPRAWSYVCARLRLCACALFAAHAHALRQAFIAHYRPASWMRAAVTTICAKGGKALGNAALDAALEALRCPALLRVSRDEYFTYLTPPSDLYDKSVVPGNEDNKEMNLKRESKAYSYKEQLEELQLRRELEEKRKKEGKVKEAPLSAKQKEAIKAQLAKESAIRERLTELNERVVVAVELVEAVRAGAPALAGERARELVPGLLAALRSPLAAPRLAPALLTLLRPAGSPSVPPVLPRLTLRYVPTSPALAGERARELVPGLLAALRSPLAAPRLAPALLTLLRPAGSPSVPPVLPRLTLRYVPTSPALAGERARELVPGLLAALRSPLAAPRLAPALLTLLRPAGSPSVPPVLPRLTLRYVPTSPALAGERARELVPGLLAALRSPLAAPRLAPALLTLLRPAGSPSVPPVLPRLTLRYVPTSPALAGERARELVPGLLAALRSPLAAPRLAPALLTLLRPAGSPSVPPVLPRLTLRLCQPQCDLDPCWEQEDLDKATVRVVGLLHATTAPPDTFDAPGFCCVFPFLKMGLQRAATRANETAMVQGLAVIERHAAAGLPPLLLPVDQMFRLLIHLISSTSGRVQAACTVALLETAQCAARAPLAADDVGCLLGGLQDPLEVVRDAALRALTCVAERLPALLEEPEVALPLAERLLLATYDVSDDNRKLAEDLWSRVEAEKWCAHPEMVELVLRDVQHPAEPVQRAAAAALLRLAAPGGADAAAALLERLQRIYEERLPLIPATLDQFGHEVVGAVDEWGARRGVGVALRALAPALGGPLAARAAAFYVRAALPDRSEPVRAAMLDAAMALVDRHGKVRSLRELVGGGWWALAPRCPTAASPCAPPCWTPPWRSWTATARYALCASWWVVGGGRWRRAARPQRARARRHAGRRHGARGPPRQGTLSARGGGWWVVGAGAALPDRSEPVRAAMLDAAMALVDRHGKVRSLREVVGGGWWALAPRCPTAASPCAPPCWTPPWRSWTATARYALCARWWVVGGGRWRRAARPQRARARRHAGRRHGARGPPRQGTLSARGGGWWVVGAGAALPDRSEPVRAAMLDAAMALVDRHGKVRSLREVVGGGWWALAPRCPTAASPCAPPCWTPPWRSWTATARYALCASWWVVGGGRWRRAARPQRARARRHAGRRHGARGPPRQGTLSARGGGWWVVGAGAALPDRSEPVRAAMLDAAMALVDRHGKVRSLREVVGGGWWALAPRCPTAASPCAPPCWTPPWRSWTATARYALCARWWVVGGGRWRRAARPQRARARRHAGRRHGARGPPRQGTLSARGGGWWVVGAGAALPDRSEPVRAAMLDAAMALVDRHGKVRSLREVVGGGWWALAPRCPTAASPCAPPCWTPPWRSWTATARYALCASWWVVGGGRWRRAARPQRARARRHAGRRHGARGPPRQGTLSARAGGWWVVGAGAALPDRSEPVRAAMLDAAMALVDRHGKIFCVKIYAGDYETSAGTRAYLLHELALQLDIQDRLLEKEIDEVMESLDVLKE
ncbi:hypothetical protein ACJJTC_007641 [Scirpophaga incertulas]